MTRFDRFSDVFLVCFLCAVSILVTVLGALLTVVFVHQLLAHGWDLRSCR